MVAYKIWHDTKHYIKKGSDNMLNVKWTTDVSKAKDFGRYGKASSYVTDVLGFNLNTVYDRLHLN